MVGQHFNNGDYEGEITNIFNSIPLGKMDVFLNQLNGGEPIKEKVKTKKDVYKSGIFKWGFITLLYLLEEYKQAQNFEECGIILSALREHYKEHNLEYLPTEYNDFAKDESQAAFWEKGFSGEIAKKNIPYYAMDLKEEIIFFEKKNKI